MKIIGEKIFARDAEGKPLSRIGTMFLNTLGLVTKRGVHAMQRVMWLDALNEARAADGLNPLTPEEEEKELELSVDLIFTDNHILIRPDPERMDLALRADEELQKMVSKRKIRFLNTNSAKVRAALCGRGENWRMARHPISQTDMAELIEKSKVPICERPIYYYNRATGTRYITASSYEEIARLDDAAFRRQVKEVVAGLNKRNRLGQLEVDFFPSTTPIEVRNALKQLDVDKLSDAMLRKTIESIELDWRMSLPSELREETVKNFEWRNAMCRVITRQPNETAAEEQELISGIAPEFYRQIEWLPGARIDRGEVIFDEIYAEAARTQDPDLASLCDMRVKSLIFNLTRLFGAIDYINVGRIARSLARKPVEGNRRGSVYIVQYRDTGSLAPNIIMIRFQKWGVAERLDEGKDLMQAMLESDEYSDYILDRRLMCRQLGMNLPVRIGYGHFTEKYHGHNQYNGVAVRTAYFVRPYVRGEATDKIAPAKFRNPAFALEFAKLMGEAAAVDLIVGRSSSTTHEILFDRNYEIIQMGDDGLPASLMVTDHAGSFTNYEQELDEFVASYADVVKRRKEFVTDYAAFADAYVDAFAVRVAAIQAAYRERKKAFDGLFEDRPFDTNGSGAYRWARALARLDRAEPEALKKILREAIGC